MADLKKMHAIHRTSTAMDLCSVRRLVCAEDTQCVILHGGTLKYILDNVVQYKGALLSKTTPFRTKYAPDLSFVEIALCGTDCQTHANKASLIEYLNSTYSMAVTCMTGKPHVVFYGPPDSMVSLCRHVVRPILSRNGSIARYTIVIGSDVAFPNTVPNCRKALDGFATFLNLGRLYGTTTVPKECVTCDHWWKEHIESRMAGVSGGHREHQFQFNNAVCAAIHRIVTGKGHDISCALRTVVKRTVESDMYPDILERCARLDHVLSLSSNNCRVFAMLLITTLLRL
jgi:hypothetical protein